MLDDEIQNPSPEFTANMVAISICAGYLNCIFKQGQLGRALTQDEMSAAEIEATERILKITASLGNNLQSYSR